jgi:DNA-binding response OmpR family regulator
MPMKTNIILAHCDTFQILYLRPALERAGAEVIVATSRMDEVCKLVDSTDAPKAVVLSSNLVGRTCWELARELHDRDIAHIVLIDSPSHDDQVAGSRSAVLHKPYAAHQVVDWFEKVQVDGSEGALVEQGSISAPSGSNRP